MNKKITSKKFNSIIEELVFKNKFTYLEAVVYYSEKNDVEIEKMVKWIDKGMEEKIQLNAELLNYLPKTNSLFK